MKILLFGKIGQLGWELQRTLQPLGQVIAIEYPEIDMSNSDSIRDAVRQNRPNVIINATAYTAVDKAESEQELAYAINATGPGVLAEEARNLNAVLIHYSTDYVFDGAKGQPYVERDVPNPLNIYGKSKLAGEQAIQAAGGAHLIFRTAWVYSTRRDSFVGKVLQWARQNRNLKIVADQVSNPTSARMLAEATTLLIAKSGADPMAYFHQNSGVYHLAGGGYTSRFEWAQEILKNDPQRDEQIVGTLEAASTKDFPTPAQRPLFSVLDCTCFEETFGLCLPEWRVALQMAMQ